MVTVIVSQRYPKEVYKRFLEWCNSQNYDKSKILVALMKFANEKEGETLNFLLKNLMEEGINLKKNGRNK